MEKEKFHINREFLLELGIDPDEAVRAIENKKAVAVRPYHITILEILRQQPTLAS